MGSALRTFVVGGVLGAGVVGGGALALAQTGTTAPPTEQTSPTTAAPGTTVAPGNTAPGGRHGRFGADREGMEGMLGRGAQALATELGVTTDQLKAAEQAARDAVQQQFGDLQRPQGQLTDEQKAKLAADLKLLLAGA